VYDSIVSRYEFMNKIPAPLVVVRFEIHDMSDAPSRLALAFTSGLKDLPYNGSVQGEITRSA
jgi:hypothetical protein